MFGTKSNSYNRRSLTNGLPTKHNTTAFPNGLWSNLFLASILVESLCSMGLEGYVFYKFFKELNLSNNTARTIPTYLAIYIFAFVFQIWLGLIAIGKRNTIQVISLVLFNLSFLVYSAFQIKEAHNVIFSNISHTNPNEITSMPDVFTASSGLYYTTAGFGAARQHLWHHLLSYLVAVPCIIGLGQIFYVVCAIKLYRVFGWDIYQKLGASTTVKNYFLSYQIFVVFLTYDWFFFGGFVVQLLILYVDSSSWSYWVTVAALPITLIGLVAAGYAVRHELKWLMLAFNICLAAALAYFIYEFWRIFGHTYQATYKNDRITLGIFAGISIVLLLLTFINSLYCQSFFGKADLWAKRKASEVDDSLPLNEMDQHYDNVQNKRLILD